LRQRHLIKTFSFPTKQKLLSGILKLLPLFVEMQACYSALFTFLVGWYTRAVSLPPDDVIFAQLACPLNNVIFVYNRNNQPISLQKCLLL
jgi:hypothetical protein